MRFILDIEPLYNDETADSWKDDIRIVLEQMLFTRGVKVAEIPVLQPITTPVAKINTEAL